MDVSIFPFWYPGHKQDDYVSVHIFELAKNAQKCLYKHHAKLAPKIGDGQDVVKLLWLNMRVDGFEINIDDWSFTIFGHYFFSNFAFICLTWIVGVSTDTIFTAVGSLLALAAP